MKAESRWCRFLRGRTLQRCSTPFAIIIAHLLWGFNIFGEKPKGVASKWRLLYRGWKFAQEDLSFAASKCYDFEAYAPGAGAWLEVSSCSNFEDFQARRANIKFKRQGAGDKRQAAEYLHTLNGSGVALARTVIAILENYQQKDGSVLIPQALRPYLDGEERITKDK